MMKLIWVTISVIGFHYYPDAPEEVIYLRENHRHKFNIKITLEVSDDNREIEFHSFKRWFDIMLTHWFEVLPSREFNFGARSCEMIAQVMFDGIRQTEMGRLPSTEEMRELQIEVDEDGENGGIVTSFLTINNL